MYDISLIQCYLQRKHMRLYFLTTTRNKPQGTCSLLTIPSSFPVLLWLYFWIIFASLTQSSTNKCLSLLCLVCNKSSRKFLGPHGSSSNLALPCACILGGDPNVSATQFHKESQFLSTLILNERQLLYPPTSKRINPTITIMCFHNHEIVFHWSYPSEYSCRSHGKVEEFDMSRFKVMKMDSALATYRTHLEHKRASTSPSVGKTSDIKCLVAWTNQTGRKKKQFGCGRMEGTREKATLIKLELLTIF